MVQDDILHVLDSFGGIDLGRGQTGDDAELGMGLGGHDQGSDRDGDQGNNLFHVTIGL